MAAHARFDLCRFRNRLLDRTFGPFREPPGSDLGGYGALPPMQSGRGGLASLI